MEIAFIGLGAMGLPMAKRLIKAEHGLHIIKHRNPLPVEELAGMGATVHEHTADAVQACDMIISILPSDKEMESVLLEESVLESAKPGALLLEMTSGSPQMMKKSCKSLYGQRNSRSGRSGQRRDDRRRARDAYPHDRRQARRCRGSEAGHGSDGQKTFSSSALTVREKRLKPSINCWQLFICLLLRKRLQLPKVWKWI